MLSASILPEPAVPHRIEIPTAAMAGPYRSAACGRPGISNPFTKNRRHPPMKGGMPAKGP